MPRQPLRRWQVIPRRPRQEAVLAARLDLHPLAAAALIASGIDDVAEARAYLSGSIDELPSPLSIGQMERAVEIVLGAVRDGEPILLHGDYDADGVCSTAILARALERLGATAYYFLPDRVKDSYGVSGAAIKDAARTGIKVVVTSDCGIAAHEEVELAKRLGMRVVVLDHHLPPETLPPADAIVAPRLPDWEYECAEMPASGLALRFVQALAEASGGDGKVAVKEFADLAAVGIVADVAPMRGENRVMVRAGLDRLPQTQWIGLRALQEIAGVGKRVRAWDVAFRIAPRINAVGRVADATDALELLMTDDETQARQLALYLDAKNRERQKLQDQIYREALEMVGERPELLSYPVLVLSSPDWHIGVVGIVAAKLVEEFARPTVLLVEEGDQARGSARSIENFDITFALGTCAEILTGYGGHTMAAGLRLPTANIELLRQLLCECAEQLGAVEAIEAPARRVIPARLEEIDETLPGDLARLEPFGPGNPEPLFALHSLRVVEARAVGRGDQHLKLFLSDGTRTVEAIAFGMGHLRETVSNGGCVDICAVPMVDEYWGPPQVQLRVEGLRPAQK